MTKKNNDSNKATPQLIKDFADKLKDELNDKTIEEKQNFVDAITSKDRQHKNLELLMKFAFSALDCVEHEREGTERIIQAHLAELEILQSKINQIRYKTIPTLESEYLPELARTDDLSLAGFTSLWAKECLAVSIFSKDIGDDDLIPCHNMANLLEPEIMLAAIELGVDTTLVTKQGNEYIKTPNSFEALIINTYDGDNRLPTDTVTYSELWTKIIEITRKRTNPKLYSRAITVAKDLAFRFHELDTPEQEREKYLPYKIAQFEEFERLREQLTPITKTNTVLLMPNNKLANKLPEFTEKENLGTVYEMKVINAHTTQKGKYIPEVTTTFMCEYENLPKNISSKLTEFDRSVSDAVVSLWKAAKDHHTKCYITPEAIHSLIPGAGPRVTDNEREAIYTSVEKLSLLRCELDATEEVKKYDPSVTSFKIRDNYLHAKGISIKQTNGRYSGDEKDVWFIVEEPLIYTYARKTNQIITLPKKYLTVTDSAGKPLKTNETRSAFLSYLLRRIETMKNQQNKIKNNNILLSSIFEAAGRDLHNSTSNKSTARVLKKRDTEFIIQCFSSWKEQGYITDYKINTKNEKDSKNAVIVSITVTC